MSEKIRNDLQNLISNYLPVVQDTLNNEDPVISKIIKEDKMVYGKQIMITYRYNNLDFAQLQLPLITCSNTTRITLKDSINNFQLDMETKPILQEFIEDTKRKFRQLFYLGNQEDNFNSINELFKPDYINYEQLGDLETKASCYKGEGFNISALRSLTKDKDFIIVSNKIKNLYMDYLKSEGHLEGYKKEGVLFTPFTTLIVFNGLPDNIIYLINSKDFKIEQLGDWTWLPVMESSILADKEHYTTYYITLVKYMNVICTQPKNQYKIILQDTDKLNTYCTYKKEN